MDNKLKITKILKYAKKLKAINYLGGSCKSCGEKNIFKLTFHHVNIDDKEFEFNEYQWSGWNKLESELKKCDLLCQNCHRELHYKNETKYNGTRRRDKLIYLEYSGGCCVDCGYSKCPASLGFHHRDPNEKEFWIGGLSERINSIFELDVKIKNEIDKCDLLCQNCHVLKHSDIDFFEIHKKEILEKLENYKEKQKKLNVSEIIEMYKNGYKQIEIAKSFKASKGTISDIFKKYKIKGE